METRRRKRAEASSSAPSPSAKRTRLSSSSFTAAAATTASSSGPTTRSRSSKSQDSSSVPTPMDESSAQRGRRGRNQGADKDNSDKGKEKEHEIRVRDRDTEPERGLGLNIDGSSGANNGDDDDDNDSEEGVGILHQNLTSASSALQGLLRKLGAGLDDLLPSSAMGSASSSHQSGRLKKILSGLRADGEDGKQVEALTQLCELLSIGTEDSLSTFSVDSFVPVLVGLLNHETNPDIMLLAARAITHLVDVLPSSCSAVVHYGAISCFCARLLTIEYMDLAEQSLQALKKISQEHPTACLRAGALMAVLSYLDFFSTGVQRVAVSTAANMCKKLPLDAADFVMDAIPHLTNLLHYHDAKVSEAVLEHASVCLTRIVEAFASSPDKLGELCNHGLVTQTASLISASSSGGGLSSLSTSTYAGLIRLLATVASGSSVGAKTLLLLGISGILRDILAGSGQAGSMSAAPSLSKPPEQIFEIVNLANELLPPLPQGVISLPASSNFFMKGSFLRKSTTSSSNKQEDTNEQDQDISAREKLLNDQPELLHEFGMDLFPVMTQIYGSSVSSPVRYKCLSVIGKLMYFGSADMISSLNTVTNMSSFLAGVLASKDSQVSVPALQISEILMQKLPDTFSKMFIREGLVHAVDSLFLAGVQDSASAQTLVAEKESGSTPGISSRSRRLRRRSGNTNADPSSAEESKNAAAVVGSPPSSVETPTMSSCLRATVSAAAKAFKDNYFPSDPGTVDVGVSEDLLQLKNLSAKLNADAEDQKANVKGKSKVSGRTLDFVASKEQNLVGTISEMLTELSKGDGVSTFEFIGSGVVAALLNYFSCGYFSKEKISEANLPKLRQHAVKRYKAFISMALPTSVDRGTMAPMCVLVQKLQNALSSMEQFPVVLSHSARSPSGNGRLSSCLSAISQSLGYLRLRLCRAPGEKSLRDYSNTIVVIDPLASLSSVEDFLWPRVQLPESGQKTTASVGNSESGTTPTGAGASSPSISTPALNTRRKTRSKSAANTGEVPQNNLLQEKATTSSKGKGKAVFKPGQEEKKGPQTRNAIRRNTALEDSQVKPADGVSSSEDEELDMSPVEIDEALVIEDDDISDDEDDNDHEVDLDGSLLNLPCFCTRGSSGWAQFFLDCYIAGLVILFPLWTLGLFILEVKLSKQRHDQRCNFYFTILFPHGISFQVLRDESLPGCVADKVHDVKLGDSADENTSAQAGTVSRTNPASGSSSRVAAIRGLDSSEFRSGSSFGSRGAMSFAAAAMAGLASSNGRGIRGERENHGRPLIKSKDLPRLVFSAAGKQLNRNLTIYQAIQQQLVVDEDDDERYPNNFILTAHGSRLCGDVYTIYYQKADSQADMKAAGGSKFTSSSKCTKVGASPGSSSDVAACRTSLFDSILQGDLPCNLERSNPTYDILALLRVLEGLNQLAPRLRVQSGDKLSEGLISTLDELSAAGARLPSEEFVNSKLTPKLARQILDALALCSGSLPSWCYQLTRACPFLFPFETRRQFFYSTAFGLSFALHRLQQQQRADGQGSVSERGVRLSRLRRQKVRVSRNRILESAAKVMEMYSSQKAVLEAEYFGEEGTGLGPTLEFYTLLSHDLQKVELGMWRIGFHDKHSMEIDGDDQPKNAKSETVYSSSSVSGSEDLVQSRLGLFPRPWPPNSDSSDGSRFSKVIEYFRLLGRVLAKALQDGRLLDLPLSSAFYKLMLGQDLDLYDILLFDPEFGRILQELQALVYRKQHLESVGSDNAEAVIQLRFRGALIDDLCLDFTLPGYPDYILKPGEENVDINNLEEYISLVVDATVRCGIARQMEAFRAGFNEVFDISNLQLFSPSELDCLLCGHRELWKAETLVDHIKFDHGYTAKSPAIINLLEIMGEFTLEQQRSFCQFVTGSPRLPSGGLAVLNPMLTIHSSTATNTASNGPGAAEFADDDLPSVMTCANYLKLPPYSTKGQVQDWVDATALEFVRSEACQLLVRFF
ncbi:E3 ubiquitin-protein ligase upl3 [Dionaea muscipula]